MRHARGTKKEDPGYISPESSSGIATEIALHRFHIDIINASLNTLRMYDEYLSNEIGDADWDELEW